MTSNESNPNKIPSVTTIECRGCEDFFRSNTILKHLSKKKKCNEHYTELELNSLKDNSKKLSTYKAKEYKQQNRETYLAQKAKNYQRNKEIILKQRAEHYQKKKAEIEELKHEKYIENRKKSLEKSKKTSEEEARRSLKHFQNEYGNVFKENIEHFKIICEKQKDNIPHETLLTLCKLEEDINDFGSKFENKIHVVVEKIQNVTCDWEKPYPFIASKFKELKCYMDEEIKILEDKLHQNLYKISNQLGVNYKCPTALFCQNLE